MLSEIIRNRLSESGDLNKVKSELRAMVLNTVRGGDKSPMNSLESKEEASPTEIANHLVLQYLQWIGFQFTTEVFLTESGSRSASPQNVLEPIAKEGFDKDLPLLVSLAMDLLKK